MHSPSRHGLCHCPRRRGMTWHGSAPSLQRAARVKWHPHGFAGPEPSLLMKTAVSFFTSSNLNTSNLVAAPTLSAVSLEYSGAVLQRCLCACYRPNRCFPASCRMTGFLPDLPRPRAQPCRAPGALPAGPGPAHAQPTARCGSRQCFQPRGAWPGAAG